MESDERTGLGTADKASDTESDRASANAETSGAADKASDTGAVQRSDTAGVRPGRLVSLDVFRGMTIAAMILVNNSGGPSYGPLDHAEWNGWTHTDLIFPFFMFIAGASMALSFAARLGKGDSRRGLATHTVRRGAIIFGIGLWLNAFPYFFDANRYANLRIPGVLQRIGFCYIFAGIIYLYTSRRARIATIAIGLLGYWAAMRLVPVPGVGAGDLSPNNNLAAFVDNTIFTARHMWQHRPWDPEGLLSSVPAICTLLLGTFVGELFAATRKAGAAAADTWQYRVKQLVLWGAAAVVLGEVWNLWFPINKNLWTSSYVVFTAGYAMLALAACYWVVDVKGWRAWATPFLVFGSNAILAFTLSTWATKILLGYRVPNGHGGSMSVWSWLILNTWRPHFADVRNSSLAFALSYVLIWMAVMWWFWRKRIFVKV